MRTPMLSASLAVVCGLALTTHAHAQDADVKTAAAESAKVGAEFRAELKRDDHGLDKATGYTPDATTSVELQKLKLKFSGKINSSTEFKMRFNLLNPTSSPVDYAYATHNMGPMGLSLGKMKVLQGGWDNMDNSFRDHVQGPYASNLAFSTYSDMIAFSMAVAGKVTLQLVNDVSGAKAQWNKGEHPTFILGWQGDLGGVSPIFDIGSYDNNKSRWIDLGVKADLSGLKAGVDIKSDSIVAKGVDDDGKAKGYEDTAMSYTLKVAYELKGTATPWFYYSAYDRKQYEDKDKNLEDSKTNPAPTKVGDKMTYSFSDNGTALGLGADLAMLGKGWTPYLAIVSQSGKFPKDSDPTKEETKTNMLVRLGMLGEF